MAPSIDLPGSALVAMTHDSLLALRASMFRDLGTNAAALLQEAGYAGGQSMFNAFGRWLAAEGRSSPESLPAAEFGLRAAEFFRATGWGTMQLGALETVATLDSTNWAESDPAFPLEFPGCYYTAGVLADFFGRIAGEATRRHGSRMSVDGRRPVSLSDRKRRNHAAHLRRHGSRAVI